MKINNIWKKKFDGVAVYDIEVKKTKKNNIILFLPIILLEIFLWIGYLFYVIGPWKFPFRYDIRTFLFLLLANLSIAAGYIYSIRKKKKENTVKIVSFNNKSIYNIILILGVIMYVPICQYRTGFLFPPVISALTDPGKTYYEILGHILEKTSVISHIAGILYIVSYVLIVLTFYYWNELKTKQKIIGFCVSFGYIIIELCTGKSLGIVIYSISIIICYLARLCGGYFIGKRKQGIEYTIGMIIILFLMVFLFNYNLQSRTRYTVENEAIIQQAKEELQNPENIGTPTLFPDDITPPQIDENTNSIDERYKYFYGSDIPKLDMPIERKISDFNLNATILPDYYVNQYALAYVHTEDNIYKLLPDNLKFLYANATYYLSHGYHSLSMALYEPFECSFGVGHLKTIDYYLNKIFNISFFDRTYEHKLIENGWPVGLYWQTAYTQFASDFSFPLTIVLMFFMGWLLGMLWIEILIGINAISVVLFSFYCVQFFFFTSAWYAGLSGGYFITFYLPLVCWFILRRKGLKYSSGSNKIVFREFKQNGHDL